MGLHQHEKFVGVQKDKEFTRLSQTLVELRDFVGVVPCIVVTLELHDRDAGGVLRVRPPDVCIRRHVVEDDQVVQADDFGVVLNPGLEKVGVVLRLQQNLQCGFV
jgi:hypothetical protein